MKISLKSTKKLRNLLLNKDKIKFKTENNFKFCLKIILNFKKHQVYS